MEFAYCMQAISKISDWNAQKSTLLREGPRDLYHALPLIITSTQSLLASSYHLSTCGCIAHVANPSSSRRRMASGRPVDQTAA